MNVTYIHADKAHEWNSAEWRCSIPARALNRTRFHRAKLESIQNFAEINAAAEYACEDADVIVLQRGAMPDTWPAVDHWRQRGKLVLADIDDGYPQITEEHPAFPFWHQGIITDAAGQPQRLPRPAIYEMADGLRRLKGLTAPNRLILADWLAAVGIRGAYLPNYPQTARYLAAKRTRSPKDDGTVWIAWGGSAGHLVSFTRSNILYALSRVMAKRPNTRFVMCGADVRIVDSLPLRPEQKINLHWRPYREWPERLVNFDIGLIPVAGDFDARRSWLKPLEYSLCNVPWIASKSPAYARMDEYGVFVDNTIESWTAAIEGMLTSGHDAATVRRAHRWACAQDIDANVDSIVNTYAELAR